MFWELIDTKKLRRALLYLLVLAGALLLQNGFMARLRPMGAALVFIPAYVVAVALFEGSIWGGVMGLAAGWLCDQAFTDSVVLCTLLFPLLGYGAGWAAEKLVNRRFFPYLLLALTALLLTALAQLLRAVAAGGVALCGQTLTLAVLQALWSLPMAALLYLPCKALAGR